MQTKLVVRRNKIAERKTDDFIWKIGRRMQYNNKILFLKDLTYHHREVIVLFY